MKELLDISAYMGLPPNASAHGPEIDYMIGLVHLLMLLLVLIWTPYFIYVLIRFRKSRNPKADYVGSKSRFSSYVEGGVVLAEVVLLFGFAIPTYAVMKRDFPPEPDALVVHVVAEQFAWNIHYPGPDGVFGKRDINLMNAQTNPIGLDRSDPNASDDITTINELHLPVDRPVTIHLSSKDVIHSFALPIMRVKQDVIPGLVIPVWFIPTQTGESEIACAQLCGLSHYRMRGFLTVHPQDEFEAWLASQAPPAS